ncbi:MAG: hypothetical protein DRG58_04655 [Deltaproteobacteria bacterium]|nr:MAG: hypothetical protein DRG58_04655 [Deltaproteobacteria bacterium]
MEVQTILWPTDLSMNSLKATKHVISLAEKYQAEVIMLYIDGPIRICHSNPPLSSI